MYFEVKPRLVERISIAVLAFYPPILAHLPKASSNPFSTACDIGSVLEPMLGFLSWHYLIGLRLRIPFGTVLCYLAAIIYSGTS